MKGETPPAARQLAAESNSEDNGSLKREYEENEVDEPPTVDNEKSAVHHEPAGECLVCYDALETRNYAEYTTQPPVDSSQNQAQLTTDDETGGEDHKSRRGDVAAVKESLHSKSNGERQCREEDTGPLGSCCSAATAQTVVWYPAKFCVDCIEELRTVQFKRYCDSVANTTCAREQRALLKRGPPVNLRDRMAFPESNDQEIQSLWYAADNTVRTAKLKGSLEGQKRQALWDRFQQFLIEDEEAAEEGEGKLAKNS